MASLDFPGVMRNIFICKILDQFIIQINMSIKYYEYTGIFVIFKYYNNIYYLKDVSRRNPQNYRNIKLFQRNIVLKFLSW